MSPNNVKLTVVILDFMKGQRVIENVKLVLEQKVDFILKIIVIDNSCDKRNADILRQGLGDAENIELVINSRNSGYIKAHNEISDKIEGKYLLILNPDILLRENDTLQKMVNYMDANPEIGVLGPKQVNDTGEIAMTVRAFPKFYLQVARRTFLRNLPLFKRKVAYDEMRHLDYSKIQDVDWLQSSCVAVKTELWKKIGGLNEDYFLFMSDAELCLESWKNGLRVVYYPETQVYADGKRVSAGGFATFFRSWVLRQHVKDSLKYNLAHLFSADPRKKYYEAEARRKGSAI
ncbi:MAG: glycosyltransferase [Candidatus Moranbacteria bacterium]|nr:glycosyltransferase [Candidatus Moranbacteria bacterium]